MLSHSGIAAAFDSDHDAGMILRDALRARVEQFRSERRTRLSDDDLDRALVIPDVLHDFITPDTHVDRAGIVAISDALLRDLEARGDDYADAPFWFVHDSSGRTESDVTWGVGYATARILNIAEVRLLDDDAHRFPRLPTMMQL